MELCKRYPVFCTIWAFMEVVLFAGVIFGWGSLVFILKTEGFYLDSCMTTMIQVDSGFIMTEHVDLPRDNVTEIEPALELEVSHQSDIATYDIKNSNISTEDQTKYIEESFIERKGCADQESKLNLWFTIAVSFMYLSFGGIGYAIKRFGTRATRITFFIIYLIGTLCLAFASPDTPWLLLPGLCCMGTGGLVLLATNMQVSYLHPRLRSTIVAIFTGLFDFSSINKQLVRLMYEYGIARRYSYIMYSIMFAIIVLISTLFFLPRMNINEEFMKNNEKKKKSEEEGEEAEKEKMKVTDVVMEPVISIPIQQGAEAELILKSNHEDLEKIGLSTTISLSPQEKLTPSLGATILSITFIFHLCWLFVHALRFVTFIGQLNIWLSKIFDKDEVKVGQMLGIFSYMTMGAIGTALFCGFVYDYLRTHYMDCSDIKRIYLPVVLPMILVIFYSAGTTVCCYIQHEIAAYMAFVFFTFFRSSLFTVAVAFVGDAFPAEYFGVMFGMLQVSAGIAGLIQYPLFTWYDAYFGSYMHVNILLLVLQVLTLIHPLILFIKGKRDHGDKRNNPFRKEYTVSVPQTA